jgi:hypothetical protein
VWLDRHGDGTRELPDGVVRVTSLQGVVDLVAGGAAAPRLGVGRACG